MESPPLPFPTDLRQSAPILEDVEANQRSSQATLIDNVAVNEKETEKIRNVEVIGNERGDHGMSKGKGKGLTDGDQGESMDWSQCEETVH